MKLLRWIAGTSIALAALPMLSLLLAAALASSLGCAEAQLSAQSCAGGDSGLGRALQATQEFGWWARATAPYAIGMGLAWLSVEAARAARDRRRRAANAAQPGESGD